MHVSRPIILAFAIVAASTGARLASFLVTELTAEIEIVESVRVVGDRSISLSMEPGETFVWDKTFTNSSDVDSRIDLPLSHTGEVDVEAPESIVIPANGETTVAIVISAKGDAAPGHATVTIGIAREGG